MGIIVFMAVISSTFSKDTIKSSNCTGLPLPILYSLYKLYNIGNGKPVQLLNFIESLEKELGITAIKNRLPMQAGDVHQTFADTSSLENDYNYKPQITVDKGIKEFVLWYKGFYNK